MKFHYNKKRIIKKMIEFLLTNNVYIWAAGALAFISFLLLNWGSSKSAENTQQNITNSTKIEVQNAIKEIVEASTDAIKLETENAVKDITILTDEMKNSLNHELSLIDSATKNLKNQIENQDILVQVEFSLKYKHDEPGLREDFYSIMQFELMNNNFYELKLISNGFNSIFSSENNSFQVFDERLDGHNNIENSYLNGWSYSEMASIQNPQKIRVNYLLRTNKIGFIIDDIKLGDIVEFSIRKRTSSKTNTVKKPWNPTNSPFVDGFASFVIKDDASSWPKGSIQVNIKLRNGSILKCKTIKTNFLGEIPNYGFKSVCEINEIYKP